MKQEQNDCYGMFQRIRSGWFSIVCDQEEIEVCLCIPPKMNMHCCAIVLCNKKRLQHGLCEKHVYITGDVQMTNIMPYIFEPRAAGFLYSTDVLARLNGFAEFCNDYAIDHIFIKGHFNQAGAEQTGRGFIPYRSGDVKIHTMDINKALKDSFLKYDIGVEFQKL